MTVLKGITPTPEQLQAAYRETFDQAIDEAGGKDLRITRAAAERLKGRDDAGALVADNILNFLDATGQKSVSAKKFAKVLGDYVHRHAERQAGSNRKLSLVETRNLPKDLRADVLHLRGKDNRRPMLPRVGFNENDLYEMLPGWKPAYVLAEGRLLCRGDQLTGIELSADLPAELKPVAEQALNRIWERGLQYRAWNDEPMLIGPRDNGTMRFGDVIRNSDDRPYLMVHWRDIDDNSFAWLYDQNADGTWTEAAEVYLN